MIQIDRSVLPQRALLSDSGSRPLLSDSSPWNHFSCACQGALADLVNGSSSARLQAFFSPGELIIPLGPLVTDLGFLPSWFQRGTKDGIRKRHSEGQMQARMGDLGREREACGPAGLLSGRQAPWKPCRRLHGSAGKWRPEPAAGPSNRTGVGETEARGLPVLPPAQCPSPGQR